MTIATSPALVPVGRTAFVDQVTGDDATGLVGQATRPFATVQAAVTAAYAYAVTNTAPVAVVLAPGDYAEDVTTPSVAASVRCSFIGAGTEDSQIRSLELTAPAAPASNEHHTELMQVGLGFLAGQTREPLRMVENGAGTTQTVVLRAIDVEAEDSSGRFAVVSDYPTPTGQLFVFVNTCSINLDVTVGSLTGVGGIQAQHGSWDVEGTRVQAEANPAIQVDGDADLTFRVGQIWRGGATAGPTVLSTTTSTVTVFDGGVIADGANADAFIRVTDAAAQLQLLGDVLLVGGATPTEIDFTAPAVFAYMNIVALLPTPHFPVVAGAGFELLISRARSLAYAPATPPTLLTSGNVQDALTSLVRGRWDGRAELGAGDVPYVMAPTDRVVPVDTAAIAAPSSVTLPPIASVGAGKCVLVYDATGDAAANPITVSASGGETVNGAASIALGADRASRVIWAQTPTRWAVVAGFN